MRGDVRKGRSRAYGATAYGAAVLALVISGCGGAKSPPAVHLVLTAPSEGAEVSVSSVKVFGTVEPASAAVVVSGRHAHVAHGAFARWMTLHRGLSHIKVVATAAGYAPAKLDVAVRSAPSARRHSSPAAPSTGQAATATGHRYTARLRVNFVSSCVIAAGATTGAEEACWCALEHVEARVSESALIALERAWFKGEAKLPRWAVDLRRSCRKT